MAKRKSKVKSSVQKSIESKPSNTDSKADIKPKDLSWLFYVALGISFVAFLLVRFKYMDIPLDRDEGSYLYQGWALLQGEVPYIDFYEMKPPGLFFIYAVFHFLFGSSGFLIHVGLLLLILHAAYMIYSICCKLDFDRKVGLTSALIWCVLSINIITNAYGLMSEYFLVWTILLSAFFTLKYQSKKHWYWLLAGGMALGLAAMIRQHAIFLAPIFPLILFFMNGEGKTAVIKRFGVFTLGALLVIGVFLGAILIYGSWDEMMYWVIERPSSSYTASRTWAQGEEIFYSMLNNIKDLTPAPFFGGLVGLVSLVMLKADWWKKVIVLLLVIGGLASVVPGYRFYGHYWIIAFWGWSLLGGAVIGIIGQFIKHKKVASILQALLLLIFGFSHIANNPKLYLETSGREVVNRTYGKNPQEAVEVLSKYAKRKMTVQDEFYVYGSEPQAYYYTKKIDKSKHAFVGFIQKPGPKNNQYQQDVIKHLKQTKPKYILHVQNAFSQGFKEESDQALYSWIYRFEQSDYKRIAVADIFNYRTIKYLYDKKAQNYQTETDNYVILYERKY